MKKVIIGIDPGYESMGYAVCTEGLGTSYTFAEVGTIGSSPSKDFSQRLLEIGDNLETLLRAHPIHEAAIEKLFFSPFWKSGLQVAEARGVILATLARAGISVFEYAPTEVKRAITGHGKSPKATVAAMVMKICHLREPIREDNAADAAAIALTHFLGGGDSHAELKTTEESKQKSKL